MLALPFLCLIWLLTSWKCLAVRKPAGIGPWSLTTGCSVCQPGVLCRGTVIGILKALLGLSASIYTTLYVAFLEPDEPKFLLMLAIGPSLIALCVAPFINFVPFIQVEPHTKAGLPALLSCMLQPASTRPGPLFCKAQSAWFFISTTESITSSGRLGLRSHLPTPQACPSFAYTSSSIWAQEKG